MTPYRSAPLAVPPPTRWWKRPLCWLTFGHTWKVTRRLKGSGHLSEFHPRAACDAYCLRCGKTWLDYDSVREVRRRMFPELFKMSRDEFPHNEYDSSSSQGANCDHMRYMLEGYRDAVRGGDLSDQPYSPGGARDISWSTGFKQAVKDMASRNPPFVLPDVCPECRTPYVNVEHPMKPGVIMQRTCKCEVTTQPIEGGTVTFVTPPNE